ncbi:nucleotidyltransferase domain-containing protein [Streptomyces youssoufiensis]
MAPTPRWKQLLDDRLAEAINVLGAIPGVHGLIVGGSLGRGEPWPMSDIDLLPVYVSTMEPSQQVEQRQSELVDWWAASGHAQTLDTGWLAFTTRNCVTSSPQGRKGSLSAWPTNAGFTAWTRHTADTRPPATTH